MEVSSVTGDLSFSFPTSANVHANTTSGRIRYEGDFAPGGELRKLTGMPADRKNHGILRSDVRRELEAAGFVLRGDIEDWADGTSCLVFQKPARITPTRQSAPFSHPAIRSRSASAVQ